MIRRFASALAACGVLALIAPAAAQQYPNQAITAIVPFAPGGSNDVLGRLADQILRAKFGQPLIITNRPGAGGNPGALAAAQAKPDGYTLLITSNVMASSTLLFSNAGYDPLTAFVGVTMIAETYTGIIVPAKSPLNSVQDLVAEAKRRPGELAYSTGGVGSGGHVAAELLSKLGGVSLNHIPYGGGAPAVRAVLSNEVAMAFSPVTNAIQLVKSGELKMVGLVERTRPREYANLPVMAEIVPDAFVPPAWVSVFAPKGTPKEITDLLSTTLRTGFSTPEMQARIAETGFTSVLSDGPTLEKRFADDHAKWKAVIPVVGLKTE